MKGRIKWGDAMRVVKISVLLAASWTTLGAIAGEVFKFSDDSRQKVREANIALDHVRDELSELNETGRAENQKPTITRALQLRFNEVFEEHEIVGEKLHAELEIYGAKNPSAQCDEDLDKWPRKRDKAREARSEFVNLPLGSAEQRTVAAFSANINSLVASSLTSWVLSQGFTCAMEELPAQLQFSEPAQSPEPGSE